MQVASNSYLSPPAIAKRFGIDVHKVILWIRKGELHATNLATTTGGRPRWKVSPADLALFEAARAAGPQPRVVRRRRKALNVIEFF